MSRLSAFALVALTLLGSACSDPKCPRDMVQHGGRCSRCPEGSVQQGNECFTTDGGVLVDPVEADEDAEVEREPDASPEMDAAAVSDAALAPMDSATSDASTDAGDGAVSAREYALGSAGAPCPSELEQSLACEGHASRKILKCQQGTWQVLQTCGPSERCDSRVGTEQGTCATIPAACVGKTAGDVCDGLERLECGIDLVSVTNRACPEHTQCDATSGTRCLCDTGYMDDAQGGCRNPDDCPAGACSGGKCVDGLADYSCNCNSGFAGTGTKKCTAVLYCPKDACTPGGTCVDTMNWSCQCGAGYAGTGTQACTNQNDCPSNRCVAPNGVCQDQVGTYRCTCNTGFSGTDCVNDICAPNPCRNGGTCSRTGMLCTCAPGFSGANCQTDVCNPNPCQHGGVCSRGTAASCNCAGTGYQGANCEVAVDPCSGTTNACGGSCMTQLAHPPGENCTNGLVGACARAGKYVCQGTAATVCNAPSVAAGREVCGDNIDNDCDGQNNEDDATDVTTWYEDCDGDGYSALTEVLIASNTGTRRACTKPPATSGCSGWTSRRPQAPQTGVAPVAWDCDDSSTAYSPVAAFGMPPNGKSRIDLNCDNVVERLPRIMTPNDAFTGYDELFVCDFRDSCTDCLSRYGVPNAGRWIEENPPCSTPGSNAHFFSRVGVYDSMTGVITACPGESYLAMWVAYQFCR